MARGKNSRKRREKREKQRNGVKGAGDAVSRFLRPTEAREAHNDFQSAGVAVKIIAPIDTLKKREKLSQRQYDALARYADVANAAERSEIKSNIDFSIYGTAEGLPHFGVRMNIELGAMDRALGSLREIAYAICVKEWSVSEYAMDRGGSVMREKPGSKPRQFIRWYEPKRSELDAAMLDLRMAGERLAAYIGA